MFRGAKSLRLGFVLAIGLFAGVAASTASAQTPPGKEFDWAFPFVTAADNRPPLPPIEGPQQLPGSTQSYTQQQLDVTRIGVDWFPESHLPMPTIVKDGSANGGSACGSCHLANGRGHPESADLTRLPAKYILKAMKEFRSGARRDTGKMNTIAMATSDHDVREAARWFASLKTDTLQWTKVVETDTVPKTYLGPGRMRFVDPDAEGPEPIGHRIITVPEDVARARARDPASGFIAYVPPGSLARGKALALGRGGKNPPCASCHGVGLHGMGAIPPIAGAHPIYLVRELYNVQTGARHGPDAALMKGVVAKLSGDDIIALAAYVGSLPRHRPEPRRSSAKAKHGAAS